MVVLELISGYVQHARLHLITCARYTSGQIGLSVLVIGNNNMGAIDVVLFLTRTTKQLLIQNIQEKCDRVG